MNIPMFQLLFILLYLMHGGERQSPSADTPKKSLIVHGELHPEREKLEDPWVDGWNGEEDLGSCRLEM